MIRDLLACAAAPVEPETRRLYTEVRGRVKVHDAEGRDDCCVNVPCTHCAVVGPECMRRDRLSNDNRVREERAWQLEIGRVDPTLVPSRTEAVRTRTGTS